MTSFTFDTFREVSCVALSAIAGVLIAIPLTATSALLPGPAFLAFFGILGAIVGMKQRKQPLFFYLALVTVLVMATLILNSVTA